ncbi:MAG: hypothetical protein IT442_12590 [Phycisphaeraceae bacterium]|nr:hypothetical protein [Phycisphaeraceae bacterium]
MRQGLVYYCQACGYDLRGSARIGRCPECGAEYDMKLGYGVRHEVSQDQQLIENIQGGAAKSLRVAALVVLLAAGGLMLWGKTAYAAMTLVGAGFVYAVGVVMKPKP